jgi:hypothetical protein
LSEIIATNTHPTRSNSKGFNVVAISVGITVGDTVGQGVIVGVSGVNCPDDCTVRTG